MDDIQRHDEEEIEFSTPRYPERQRVKPTMIEPTWKGQSYFQRTNKHKIRCNTKLKRSEMSVLTKVLQHFNICMFHKNYSIRRARKQWGDAAVQLAIIEMKQLHNRICMTPVDKKILTRKELAQAMESFSFLIEKEKKQEIKSRHVANGSTQRPFVDKRETASPTVSTDALLVTAAIDGQEH